MTEAVNTEQVKALFDRWGRLEDDAKAISEDKAELFAEAKEQGFNTKALRKAFRIMRAESLDGAVAFQADVEMYLTALGLDLAPARVREIIEEIPPRSVSQGLAGEPAGKESADPESAGVSEQDVEHHGSIGAAPAEYPDLPEFLDRRLHRKAAA